MNKFRKTCNLDVWEYYRKFRNAVKSKLKDEKGPTLRLCAGSLKATQKCME